MQMGLREGHCCGFILGLASGKFQQGGKNLNEYLHAIRGLLKWMREKDRIPACPLKTVKKVDGRGKEKRVRRALSFEEMQSLLDVCGPRKAVTWLRVYRPASR